MLVEYKQRLHDVIYVFVLLKSSLLAAITCTPLKNQGAKAILLEWNEVGWKCGPKRLELGQRLQSRARRAETSRLLRGRSQPQRCESHMRLYHRQSTLVSAHVSTSPAPWPVAGFPPPNFCASVRRLRQGSCGYKERGATAQRTASATLSQHLAYCQVWHRTSRKREPRLIPKAAFSLPGASHAH